MTEKQVVTIDDSQVNIELTQSKDVSISKQQPPDGFVTIDDQLVTLETYAPAYDSFRRSDKPPSVAASLASDSRFMKRAS